MTAGSHLANSNIWISSECLVSFSFTHTHTVLFIEPIHLDAIPIIYEHILLTCDWGIEVSVTGDPLRWIMSWLSGTTWNGAKHISRPMIRQYRTSGLVWTITEMEKALPRKQHLIISVRERHWVSYGGITESPGQKIILTLWFMFWVTEINLFSPFSLPL